jgi:hypothetical protein
MSGPFSKVRVVFFLFNAVNDSLTVMQVIGSGSARNHALKCQGHFLFRAVEDRSYYCAGRRPQSLVMPVPGICFSPMFYTLNDPPVLLVVGSCCGPCDCTAFCRGVTNCTTELPA